MSLDIYNRYTKYIKNPPKSSQLEADWITECSHGALIFHDKYQGPVHKYDKKIYVPINHEL